MAKKAKTVKKTTPAIPERESVPSLEVIREARPRVEAEYSTTQHSDEAWSDADKKLAQESKWRAPAKPAKVVTKVEDVLSIVKHEKRIEIVSRAVADLLQLLAAERGGAHHVAFEKFKTELEAAK